MGHADDILEDVRKQIAPEDVVLAAARDRRRAILRAAKKFRGAGRGYNSGSVAYATVNDPVNDADCGLVLDRRVHSGLGPDSATGQGPKAVVEEVRDHLRDDPVLKLRYPDAKFYVQDRSIKVIFDEPLGNGQDPTVDLIVALDRSGTQPGLWIPKAMRSTSPGWSASHPEKHVNLFLPAARDLRRSRARSARFGKAWNSRHAKPYFSSFNITAWAYWGIDEPLSMAEAFARMLEWAYSDLYVSRTDDPAGVSGKIKLLTDKDAAMRRLKKARDLARTAADAETETEAQEALSKLFPDHVSSPSAAQDALRNVLRSGRGAKYGLGGLAGTGPDPDLKPTDSYGSPR